MHGRINANKRKVTQYLDKNAEVLRMSLRAIIKINFIKAQAFTNIKQCPRHSPDYIAADLYTQRL